MSEPIASLVIATRNRHKELKAALLSARQQSVRPEIIVLDDGSDDGTPAMIRNEFSDVRYVRFDGANGPCKLRNHGAQLARGTVLFLIDDDASFASPRTIEQVLTAMNAQPEIASVAIPFINTSRGNRPMQLPPPGSPPTCVSAFIGAASAVRRDVYQMLGGYRELLFYGHEESDLCLRLLSAGYPTVMLDVDPLHHSESPSRNQRRSDYYSYRNLFIFTWLNSPTRSLLPMMVGNVLSAVRNVFVQRRPIGILRGTLAGIGWLIRRPAARAAVPAWAFRLFRLLRREPIALRDISRQIADEPRVWRNASNGSP